MNKRKVWYVVETECHGERHFHYVYTLTPKSAESEAAEREFQTWQGKYVVRVISTVERV